MARIGRRRAAPGGGAGGDVVLIHGLLLSGWVMAPLAFYLRRRGWRCHVFSYPSRRAAPTAHGDALADFLRRRHISRCHFVAHSMGGLVVREFLARHGGGGGRCVALGTPFAGSALASAMMRTNIGKWILGAAASALTDSVADWPAHHPLGVISGRVAFTMRPAARLFGAMVTPGDGVVSTAETYMRDAVSVSLNCTHTMMLFDREVMRRVEIFLRHGRFSD